MMALPNVARLAWRTPVCALLWVLCLAPAVNAATTSYVSDVFYVPLHSGNSSKHRIVHRGLRSGTELTVLDVDEKAGFSKVKTASGTTGWIQNQYLSAQPIARLQLREERARLQQMSERLEQAQSQQSGFSKDNTELRQQVQNLSRQNQSLTSELASIKKISANAITLDRNHRELLEKNEMLKIDIAELQADNARLADKSDKEWFIRGSFAVILGALLAIILPKLRPKPRSSEWA